MCVSLFSLYVCFLFKKSGFATERVLELVCLLKTKGPRIYGRFLNVMSELNQENIVDILNDKETGPTGSMCLVVLCKPYLISICIVLINYAIRQN